MYHRNSYIRFGNNDQPLRIIIFQSKQRPDVDWWECVRSNTFFLFRFGIGGSERVAFQAPFFRPGAAGEAFRRVI